MKDFHPYQRASLTSPAVRARHITPSDTEDLPFISRAIAVTEDGMVRILTQAFDDVTIVIAAGAPFPIRARRIFDTGTTASGIVILT